MKKCGFYLIALVVLTALAYQPAWNGKQIWDDDQYITPRKLQPVSGLVKIWSEAGTTAQYYPLTYSAFWLEHRLWGDTPLGYHLVNIGLHLLSAILLLGVLEQLKIPGARLAVALWTLHPVQVESVAWMSELKNTLSAVFFFGAALAYLKFRSATSRRRVLYTTAFGLFVVGILAKSAIAVLPASLLVVVWWKVGKLSWRSDIVPLLPFFTMSAGFGALTAWMEKVYVGAVGPDFELSFIQRCLIAGRALWFYLAELVWPRNLTFIYVRWEVSPAIWWQWLFPIAALAVLGSLWWYRKRSRGPLAAGLLFAGILFPALGFVNIFPFRYSFVADHFQYLACAAPLTLIAAAIVNSRVPVRVAELVLSLILVVLSWQQAGMYTDIETLWKMTITRNPDCWMAYSNLGALWVQRHDTDAAVSILRKALALRSDAETQNNLGTALADQGNTTEALVHLEQSVALKPDYAEPYNGIGTIRQEQGDLRGAIAAIEKAVSLNPGYADAHYNLGVLLLDSGQIEAAIPHLRAALEIRPDDSEALMQLETALQQRRNRHS